MPLVRKEEVEDLVSEALAQIAGGAIHQAAAALVTLGRRLARAGRAKPDLERVAAAIAELLRRHDVAGMTAAEDADLKAALAALHARLAELG